MPLDQADARDFGSGLACKILRSGFQLALALFAALLPITLAAVALFVFMIALPKRALGQWHAREIGAD
jgi:hypothetical protein